MVLAGVWGVMAGGALGAWARYLVGLGLQRISLDFPWGTFCINVTGCLFIAAVAALASRSPGAAPFLERDVSTGFIGAYTTFSTFTVETLQLARTRPALALLYAAGSIAVGAAAIPLGRLIGSRVL